MKYQFFPSTRKFKKYDVYKNGKYIVSFGDKRYQQYKDKIGYYSELDHLDKKRRLRYYQRHGKDAVVESAKWFSHKYLW
jgi:hypothetical protein